MVALSKKQCGGQQGGRKAYFQLLVSCLGLMFVVPLHECFPANTLSRKEKYSLPRSRVTFMPFGLLICKLIDCKLFVSLHL